MAPSIIGIDFGNESCYIAVTKAGGIETIANDYSLRGTPSCVAFSPKKRILGVAAKNQMVTNMKNTVFGFKRLLGRTFLDPYIQNEIQHLPFKVEHRDGGGIGIRVKYLGEDNVFTPEQITAMLFTKLKECAATALDTPIDDCVISVPSYFTNSERDALLDAARIAGLNVLRLMNETTATALAYGIYKEDLPVPEEKPRNVVFVDFGHSSLQVAACAFNKRELRVLATSTDPQCGGRDIDMALANHFCQDFWTRYKLDPRDNPRAFMRLLQEVDKLKKPMSANSSRLPLNIECFMEDRDVSGDMERAQMEELCADIFVRVKRTLRCILQNAKLKPEDIHSVEIVGGSTRIPAVKGLIEQVFGKLPSTSLNQDEAVSRGCALQFAALRARALAVTDAQPYAVRLAWDAPAWEQSETEVFPTFHAAPSSKMLTFYRKAPFTVRAFYSDSVPYPDSCIGQWHIKNVRPTSEGNSQKVKLKMSINIHGMITAASVVENKQDGAAQGESHDQNGPDSTIELPMNTQNNGMRYSMRELHEFFEQEEKMQAHDKQEQERIDARNALEEYVYELRGKLSEDESSHDFVTKDRRQRLVNQLDALEKWLYDDGEDQSKPVYCGKLNELRIAGECIKHRRVDSDYKSGGAKNGHRSEDTQKGQKTAFNGSSGSNHSQPSTFTSRPTTEPNTSGQRSSGNSKFDEQTRTPFNGFSGFNTPRPSTFTSRPTTEPNTSGQRSSGNSQSDEQTRTPFNGFGGFNTSRPSTFTSRPTTEPNTSEQRSSSDSKIDKHVQYCSKLKSLNESVSSWIRQHVEESPLCNLTPVFRDYEKYLKEIEEEFQGSVKLEDKKYHW